MKIQPILKSFTVLETVIYGLKTGLKWAYRRLRIKQRADFDLLGLKLAGSKLTRA